MNQDLWLSSGASHIWNIGQTKPATDWEKEIDDLMREITAQVDQAERQRLFDQVQRIFAEHLPAALFRGAPAAHGGVGPRRRPRAGAPAAAAAVERRSHHGAAGAPLSTTDGTLSAQASRLRAAARLRRVVVGAAADAPGPRRLQRQARPYLDPADARRIRGELGLDRPLAAQYLSWLRGVVRSTSAARCCIRGRSVRCSSERALNTAVLATTALLLATAIGIPLGIYSGSRTRGLGRSIVRVALGARHFRAAADRVADAGVHRRADGMVSGRRHDVLGRPRHELGPMAGRSRAASPGARAGPRHPAGGVARTPAIAGHCRRVAGTVRGGKPRARPRTHAGALAACLAGIAAPGARSLRRHGRRRSSAAPSSSKSSRRGRDSAG